jgi:hypothetical protein
MRENEKIFSIKCSEAPRLGVRDGVSGDVGGCHWRSGSRVCHVEPR